MTDKPKPLTDAELEAAELAFDARSDDGLRLTDAAIELLDRVVGELVRKRTLIRKLVLEEGCPASDDWAGGAVCAFCDGPETAKTGGVPGADPRYDHRAECIWLELEREAQRVIVRSWRDLVRPAWEYYQREGNSVGGNLHIVLDDGNVERSHVEFCLERATAEGDEAGVVLARLLLAASRTQREKLKANYRLYCHRAPEPKG